MALDLFPCVNGNSDLQFSNSRRHQQNHLECLLSSLLASTLRVSYILGLRKGLKIWISNKFLSGVWEPLVSCLVKLVVITVSSLTFLKDIALIIVPQCRHCSGDGQGAVRLWNLQKLGVVWESPSHDWIFFLPSSLPPWNLSPSSYTFIRHLGLRGAVRVG